MLTVRLTVFYETRRFITTQDFAFSWRQHEGGCLLGCPCTAQHSKDSHLRSQPVHSSPPQVPKPHESGPHLHILHHINFNNITTKHGRLVTIPLRNSGRSMLKSDCRPDNLRFFEFLLTPSRRVPGIVP